MKGRLLRYLGATIGLISFAMVAATHNGVASEPARVVQAVQASDDDPNPSRMYSAPVLAMDPANPQHIVAASAEIRSRTCTLMRSSDAGRSWERPESFPILEEYPFCFQTETGPPQAVVAFGRDSTLYYAYAGWNVEDTLGGWPIGQGGGWRGNVSPVLARSNDLGDSWDATIVRNARGLEGDAQEGNRPVSSLAVDSVTGDEDILYLGWKATFPDHQAPLMAVSPDGGKSFSDPIDLTAGYFEEETNRQRLAEAAQLDEVPGSDEILYYWPDLTVDREGSLYAIWNARFGPGPQMDDTAAFLSKSTDGGKTFSVTELSPATTTLRYPAIEWSSQGGPGGTLHMVYEAETPQGITWLNDVYHQRSLDDGETWSEPIRLSDDPQDALTGQYHPDFVIAPNGRVDIAWWDFRNDNGNFANDVYLTSSQDNGENWSKNVRVTDRSIGRRVGVWYGNADIRQPPGLVASDALTVVGWDDTRHANDVTQTQDVYSSAVQYRPVAAGTPRSLMVVLAVASGLGVFGILLLAFTSFHRRSSSSP